MENLSLSVPDLLQTVKNFVGADKHGALDEMLKRYTSKQLGKQQLQFELRVVAGRDALRQALLAMVPQIDELQKKREAMKQQQGAGGSSGSGAAAGGGGGSSGSGGGGHGQWMQGVVKDGGGVEAMPPLQGGNDLPRSLASRPALPLPSGLPPRVSPLPCGPPSPRPAECVRPAYRTRPNSPRAPVQWISH